MIGISARTPGQFQEVKARSLQILMAVLEEITGAGEPVPGETTRHALSASAKAASRALSAMPSGETARQATVLLAPIGNRLTLSIGGLPLEVILPEPLAQAARANPALLARGTELPVEVDAETGVLRLMLPAIDLRKGETRASESRAGGEGLVERRAGEGRPGEPRLGDNPASGNRAGGPRPVDQNVGQDQARGNRAGDHGSGENRAGAYRAAGEDRAGNQRMGEGRFNSLPMGDDHAHVNRAGDHRATDHGAGAYRAGQYRAGNPRVGEHRSGTGQPAAQHLGEGHPDDNRAVEDHARENRVSGNRPGESRAGEGYPGKARAGENRPGENRVIAHSPGPTAALPRDMQAGIPAATLRNFSNAASSPSLSPAPPLPDHFPPGSPGALIQKLAQVHLPLAERGDARPAGETTPLLSGSRSIGSAALATLPPALLEASLKAAIRQMPLGNAIATLIANEAGAVAPEQVKALSTLRLDGLAKPDAPAIERGVKQSGLFFEARLANLASGIASTPPKDLKAVLNAIRESFTKEAATIDTPASAKAAPIRLPAAAERIEAPAPRGTDLPRLVEGGLERIKLQQIASLPDHPGITVTDDRTQPARLALQIPLATHGPDRSDTAMIGVMIEHQPRIDLPAGVTAEREGSNSAEGFPWKVRIALDLAETGPVQAEIGLRGQRIGITLWAERKAMADEARRAIGDLHAALTGAAFEVAHLDVKNGRPAAPAHRPSPQLDRRS
jgi:hypothetical protein